MQISPLQQKIRDELKVALIHVVLDSTKMLQEITEFSSRTPNFDDAQKVAGDSIEKVLQIADKIPALVIEEAERLVQTTELKASHIIKPEVAGFYDGAVQETKRVILQALSTLK